MYSAEQFNTYGTLPPFLYMQLALAANDCFQADCLSTLEGGLILPPILRIPMPASIFPHPFIGETIEFALICAIKFETDYF